MSDYLVLEQATETTRWVLGVGDPGSSFFRSLLKWDLSEGVEVALEVAISVVQLLGRPYHLEIRSIRNNSFRVEIKSQIAIVISFNCPKSKLFLVVELCFTHFVLLSLFLLNPWRTGFDCGCLKLRHCLRPWQISTVLFLVANTMRSSSCGALHESDFSKLSSFEPSKPYHSGFCCTHSSRNRLRLEYDAISGRKILAPMQYGLSAGFKSHVCNTNSLTSKACVIASRRIFEIKVEPAILKDFRIW